MFIHNSFLIFNIKEYSLYLISKLFLLNYLIICNNFLFLCFISFS